MRASQTSKCCVSIFFAPDIPRWAGPDSFPKKEVIGVACGGAHILVAARDDATGTPQLYSSGLNSFRELGHGDTKPRHKLTRVTALQALQKVDQQAGGYYGYNLYDDCTYRNGMMLAGPLMIMPVVVT